MVENAKPMRRQVFKSEKIIKSDGCRQDDIRAYVHLSENVASYINYIKAEATLVLVR